MDFAHYVLRKGILRYELGENQPATETCSLLNEALNALMHHNAVVSSPEDLRPDKFAPSALWYTVIKTVYERIH